MLPIFPRCMYVTTEFSEAHGGGIWLDKTYTTGASIKFTLPRDDVTQ
jgi:signal transduction histidine kinase